MKTLLDKTHRSSLSIRTVGLSVACLLGLTAVGFGYKESALRTNAHNNPTKLAVKLSQTEIKEAAGKLPLAFEPNQGQTDSHVKYIARAQGYTAFLTADQAVLSVNGAPLAMKLHNANPARSIEASEPQVGKSNYFIGNDRSKWLTNVPHFAKVTYQEVYPGIDVVYSGNQKNLEYDYVVKPGADPNQIRLAYEGATRFALNAKGDLELDNAAGRTLAHKPVVYQMINGQRKPVQGGYVLTAKNEVGFKLGSYDKRETLVIDPIATIAAAYGSSTGADAGLAVAANSQGVYLAGNTAATTNTFALTPTTCPGSGTQSGICIVGAPVAPVFYALGPYSGGTTAGGQDAFITKLSADGTTLVYSTYLGGAGTDTIKGIAVDSTGNAYVTGSSDSSNFPTTGNIYSGGGRDVFTGKIAANGQSIIYTTFFGGASNDDGLAIAVDASGNAYVGGATASTGLSMSSPVKTTATSCASGDVSNCSSGFTGDVLGNAAGTTDGLVIKYAPDATVLFSTYLGGGAADQVNSIAADASGNIYVAGTTSSVTGAINAAGRFPTTASGSFGAGTASNKIASTATAGTLGFAAKINANFSIGWSDTFSTAGTGTETATGVAADGNGVVYVAGSTVTPATPLGTVTGLTITAVGSGFTSAPTVTISGGGGFGATATAALGVQAVPGAVTVGAPGPVTAIALTTAGSGYSGTVNVIFSGAGVSSCPGLAATATLGANGAVTGFTITGNGGAGCVAPLTATLPAPTGIGSLTVTIAGQNYGSAPTVTIAGGGGTGATATATISAGSAGFTFTQLQLGAATAAGTPTGTVNGQLSAAGGQGYVLGLASGGKTASYVTYLMTPSATASVLNGIALDDANQAYVVGNQHNGVDNDIYVARLNPVGAAGSTPTPGAVNFSGTLAAATGGADAGNGIAVVPGTGGTAVPLRTAFLVGTSSLAGGQTTFTPSASISGTPTNFIVNGPTTANQSSATKLPIAPGAGANSDVTFAALTFRDLVANSTNVVFTSTLATAVNQTQTITVTGVGGGTVPTCGGFTAINKTGGFFGTPVSGTAGTVVNATATTFTVATGTHNPPALGTAELGSFQIAGTTGCPVLEPLNIGISYTASTTYTTVVTGSLSMSTPAGSSSGLPTGSSLPNIAVTSGSSVATTVTVSTPTNWTTAAAGITGGCAGSPPLSVSSSSFTASGAATNLTVTPASCFVNPSIVPATYSGTITIAPTTAGQSNTVTLPYSITVAPGLVLPTTPANLTFTFSAGATSVQQQTVSVSANGGAISYATTLTNGTIPSGALTILAGASGVLPSGNTGTIVVQVNPTGLAAGSYTGSLAITSGTATIATIPIIVNVGAAFSALFTPTVGSVNNNPAAGIAFSIPAGTASTSFGNLDVTKVGSGAVQIKNPTITFTTGTGWLTSVFSNCGGTAGTSDLAGNTCRSALSIDATSLTAGTYSANIAVTSTTSGVATVNVPVTLTVTTGPVFLQGGSANSTRLVFSTPRTDNGVLACTPTLVAGTCQFNLATNSGTLSNVSITPATTAGGSWLQLCAGASATGCTTTVALTGQTLGTANSAYTISASTLNLASGTYTGSITVASTLASGPLVIPVSLVINAQNPSGAGVYRSSGLWLLDTNFNQSFDIADQVSAFGGIAGDIPVVGDWNGDGKTKIGIYRNGTWLLDYNGNGVFDGAVVDRVLSYGGLPGDFPVVGDWNGSGFTKIGIFRQGFFWVLDSNGNGVFDAADAAFAFGGATGCSSALPGPYSIISAVAPGACDIPIVGDWNNDGTSKVGVFRSGFLWILDQTGARQFVASGPTASTVFAFGGIAGDLPVVGDWNNSGLANVGVFRSGFFWVEAANRSGAFAATPGVGSAFAFGGIAGDVPVVGRWR